MHQRTKSFLKAGVPLTVIAVTAVAALLTMSSLTTPFVEERVIHSKKIQLAWLGDPAGDASGFCQWVSHPHAAAPATTYASNITTPGSCYEYYTTALSGEATGETPHSVTVDYVTEIRVNDTVAYNATSGLWEPSRIYMNTSIDYTFGTDIPWTQCTLVEIANNSDFAWYNCYINNGGSGYTLTANQKGNASLNGTVIY